MVSDFWTPVKVQLFVHNKMLLSKENYECY